MSNSLATSENATTITLEGDLTLPRAEEIKNLFVKALEGGGALALAFGPVQEVDLSFLQLCCSLHRSAVNRKKTVRIEGAAPKALRETAEAAGYLRLAGCKMDSDRSCLWATITGGRIG